MVTKAKTYFAICIGFMMIVIFASISSAADQKIKAKVPGITWASSALAASDAAKSIPGVSFVDDDMVNAAMTIIFDDLKTDLHAIKETMKKAGFPIEGEPEILKR